MDVFRPWVLSLWVGAGACASVSSPSPLPHENTHRRPLLQQMDGRYRDLGSLSGEAMATVLVWWSNSCPCVSRYQQRIEDLARRGKNLGVAVYAVASNVDETADDIAAEVERRGFMIPVLLDGSGEVARMFDVRSTPTVVLLDTRGQSRYVGWIDNEREVGQPDRVAHLDNALEGVLAGHNEFPARSPVYGCPVTRSVLGGAGPCIDPGAVHHGR